MSSGKGEVTIQSEFCNSALCLGVWRKGAALILPPPREGADTDIRAPSAKPVLARRRYLLFALRQASYSGRGVGVQRIVALQGRALHQHLAREAFPFVMDVRLLDHLRGQRHRHADRAVVIGHDDVARHDRHAAAGDGHVDGKGHQPGLGVEVRRPAADPQRQVQLLQVGIVAQAAVDHHAGAAPALEIGRSSCRRRRPPSCRRGHRPRRRRRAARDTAHGGATAFRGRHIRRRHTDPRAWA